MQGLTLWEEYAAEVGSPRLAAQSAAEDMPRWNPLRVMASLDRRSEKRLSLVVPIRVHGFDAENHYFTEKSFTLDISRSGCRFALSNLVQRGAVLALYAMSPRLGEVPPEKALYEVVWVVARSDGWEVGARLMDQRKNIWGVKFPDLTRED